MLKFLFIFAYRGREYEAECQPFPLDGNTDLHITPHDPDLFHCFGMRILAQAADGSISTGLPPEPEAFDYQLALVKGVSAYFDDQQKMTCQ